jgi:hypothetical protein
MSGQRMSVPGGAGARLERDTCTGHACRIGAWKRGSIRTVPVNQSAGPLVELCDPALFISILFSQLSTLNYQPSTSPAVLFVADSFHPIDHFAVQRFLKSDMRHCGRRRSAVPMLLVRRKPDDVAWPDFLH